MQTTATHLLQAALLLCAAPLLAQTAPQTAIVLPPAPTQTTPTAAEAPPPIRDYIRTSWDTLSRSMTECKSVRDPKVLTAPIVYLPKDMPVPASLQKLHAECGVDIEHLPKKIDHLGDLRPEKDLKRPGLLYLPNPYVVPGGRFNEMYGWDSYFIVLGLLTDHRFELARGIAENYFFEIENYGALLNANRTYFLTRSQPPLLADMIREIHQAQLQQAATGNTGKASGAPFFSPLHREKGGVRSGTEAKESAPAAPTTTPGPNPNQTSANPVDPKTWLAHAYTVATRDYALWTSPIHQATIDGKPTGLARYFDVGEGPVLEMADDSTYYPDALRYLLAHKAEARDYLVPASAGDSASCDQSLTVVCKTAEIDGTRLSRDFYKGDRADRESGFDTTFRFGPFSGSTHHYAPVCLNALLVRYELDMAGFAKELGKPADEKLWQQRARARKAAIDKYLWDPAQRRYVDYDVVKKEHSTYVYASEFYPLWAGIASPKQAADTLLDLQKLENDHGLAMSDRDTGQQWDKPFGWAPNHYFAILGLRQYGYTADADRLAQKFRTDVETNYLREGTIREKYDVLTGSTTTQVTFGYKANGVGFGWTNGVYLRLLPTQP